MGAMTPGGGRRSRCLLLALCCLYWTATALCGQSRQPIEADDVSPAPLTKTSLFVADEPPPFTAGAHKPDSAGSGQAPDGTELAESLQSEFDRFKVSCLVYCCRMTSQLVFWRTVH
jgi:hypothetical protein